MANDSFTTVYLQGGLTVVDRYVKTLEKNINREVGIGDGYLNLYTTDPKLIKKAITWLTSEGFNVSEVAS